jgi:tetratricopeptide (TPR) repeat protein
MTKHPNKSLAMSIAIALLIFISVSPCLSADTEQAMVHFQQAIELVDKGNYKKALLAFEDSYRLSQNATVLYNIGLCHMKLENYGKAITIFQKILKERSREIDPAIAASSKNYLQQIEELVGKLYLQGAPTGVEVIVNDKILANPPLEEPLVLGPGVYSLAVIKKGYQPFRTEVKVDSGTQIVVWVKMSPVPLPKPKENEIFTSLFIGGIATGAVGVAGIVIGAVFAAKYNGDMNSTNELADRIRVDYEDPNTDPNPDDVKAYYQYVDETLPADKAGAISGFVIGGCALVASTVLFVVDAVQKKNDKKEKVVSVMPTAGGLAVRF